jgi:hypothetical protein
MNARPTPSTKALSKRVEGLAENITPIAYVVVFTGERRDWAAKLNDQV